MREIWVIGFGRFGQRAASELSRLKNTNILVVDDNPRSLEKARTRGYDYVVETGVTFVARNLDVSTPHWIIPTVPIHLAFECLLSWANKTDNANKIEPPVELDSLLPNPIRGMNKDVYLSHATWQCPEDCTAPPGMCTFTKKAPPPPLFRIMELLAFENHTSLVVRSRQLTGGVGGYRPDNLFTLRDRITAKKSPFLISTASRCHGVMSAMEVIG